MMKKKIIWHNRFENGNYIINATSDYTDEQLTIEVPLGTSYDKFYELVSNEVFNYLVTVYNAIERETQGMMGLSDNVSISGSLICHNLYKSYRSVSGGAEKESQR